MSENVTEQIHDGCKSCGCYSLQVDESTDVRDAVQVIVFICTVFHD